MAYSGTSALKTDYTRTKKRTILGVVTDGIKSCVRHYRNNYMDGYLQDCLFLFTGKFDPGRVAVEFVVPRRTVFSDFAVFILVSPPNTSC